MKILTITAQKPSATGSGIYLTELIKSFHRMGHSQALMAGVYEDDQVELPENVEFYPVYFKTPQLPFPIVGMSDEMPYENTIYNDMTPTMVEQFKQAFLQQLKKAVVGFEPDLILCHHLYLLTAIVREAYPELIIYGLCHGTDIRKMGQNPLWRSYISGQIARLDHIFCLHEQQMEKLIEVYDADKNKVTIVGSGYNSQIFRRMSEIKKEKGLITFAGKLSEKKGIFSLIRAMQYLEYKSDELRICLAGGSNERDNARLIHLISECPYKVELVGKLSQKELAEWFNRSEIFVLPSFYEGMPLVLSEAMSCGCKVICTDLPGIKNSMDQRIANHGISFVRQPDMLAIDTPNPDSLPAFERNLAFAIREALEAEPYQIPDMSWVSWDAIAQKIVNIRR